MSAGSNMLSDFTSLITSTAVERLIAEDAIIIGRQNCDEFAMGSSNENSAFGPTPNPIQPTHVPGGSSGGSAAAVAANLCHASLASDTGGSIRQPAAFCGLVGLKPTYGRVSRWGLVSYASSFDQIGPITRSVEDAARMLEVISGPDGKDQTLSHEIAHDFAYPPVQKAARPQTIGYVEEVLDHPGLDPEIRDFSFELLENLKKDGHKVVPLHFPYLAYVVPCYYVLVPAEASSNLSRYDGVRFGHRAEDISSLEDLYRKSRTEGFGTEVKRRIILGTFVLSAGYYDAYYTRAQKVRKLIQQSTFGMLDTCDFILMPTTPSTAFQLEEKTADPVEMYLSDIYTVMANLAGVPAVSLPLGRHSNGLPFGIQLLARPFAEDQLLAFSEQLMVKHPEASHIS